LIPASVRHPVSSSVVQCHRAAGESSEARSETMSLPRVVLIRHGSAEPVRCAPVPLRAGHHKCARAQHIWRLPSKIARIKLRAAHRATAKHSRQSTYNALWAADHSRCETATHKFRSSEVPGGVAATAVNHRHRSSRNPFGTAMHAARRTVGIIKQAWLFCGEATTVRGPHGLARRRESAALSTTSPFNGGAD